MSLAFDEARNLFGYELHAIEDADAGRRRCYLRDCDALAEKIEVFESELLGGSAHRTRVFLCTAHQSQIDAATAHNTLLRVEKIDKEFDNSDIRRCEYAGCSWTNDLMRLRVHYQRLRHSAVLIFCKNHTKTLLFPQ